MVLMSGNLERSSRCEYEAGRGCLRTRALHSPRTFAKSLAREISQLVLRPWWSVAPVEECSAHNISSDET